MAKGKNANSESQESAIETITTTQIDSPAEENGNGLSLGNNGVSNGNSANQEMVPQVPVDVDQLQQWKTWLKDNNGQLLAAMLQEMPTPVTRKIDMRELTGLFGLNYDPSNDIESKLNAIQTTFPEWIKKFSFSYLALTNTIAKVNSDSLNFHTELAEVGETLTSISDPDENFRKLFG